MGSMREQDFRRVAREHFVYMLRVSGMAAAQAASAMGLTPPHVSQMRSGQRAVTMATLLAAADAFGVGSGQMLRELAVRCEDYERQLRGPDAARIQLAHPVTADELEAVRRARGGESKLLSAPKGAGPGKGKGKRSTKPAS